MSPYFLSEVILCSSLEALQSTWKRTQEGNWHLVVRKLWGISHMPGWTLSYLVLKLTFKVKFFFILCIRKLNFREVKRLSQGPSVGQWWSSHPIPSLSDSLAHVLDHCVILYTILPHLMFPQALLDCINILIFHKIKPRLWEVEQLAWFYTCEMQKSYRSPS